MHSIHAHIRPIVQIPAHILYDPCPLRQVIATVRVIVYNVCHRGRKATHPPHRGPAHPV